MIPEQTSRMRVVVVNVLKQKGNRNFRNKETRKVLATSTVNKGLPYNVKEPLKFKTKHEHLFKIGKRFKADNLPKKKCR